MRITLGLTILASALLLSGCGESAVDRLGKERVRLFKEADREFASPNPDQAKLQELKQAIRDLHEQIIKLSAADQQAISQRYPVLPAVDRLGTKRSLLIQDEEHELGLTPPGERADPARLFAWKTQIEENENEIKKLSEDEQKELDAKYPMRSLIQKLGKERQKLQLEMDEILKVNPFQPDPKRWDNFKGRAESNKAKIDKLPQEDHDTLQKLYPARIKK
jgi:hypothetical protein